MSDADGAAPLFSRRHPVWLVAGCLLCQMAAGFFFASRTLSLTRSVTHGKSPSFQLLQSSKDDFTQILHRLVFVQTFPI